MVIFIFGGNKQYACTAWERVRKSERESGRKRWRQKCLPEWFAPMGLFCNGNTCPIWRRFFFLLLSLHPKLAACVCFWGWMITKLRDWGDLNKFSILHIILSFYLTLFFFVTLIFGLKILTVHRGMNEYTALCIVIFTIFDW